MKSNMRPLILALSVVVALQFAGCKKHDSQPPVEACSISQMMFTFGYQDETGVFTYNKFGNPVSFTINQTSTANPNVIFLYDQYNRLTDCLGPYAKLDPENLPSQISFDFWTRYTYADQNPASLPIADTSRTFGFRINGQFVTPITPTVNGKYTFDSQGRIATFVMSNSQTISVFTYNADGNTYAPGTTFDNKKNLHRTSKIFQLVDKNYNANNLVAANTYNNSGYPLTFPISLYPNSNATFLRRQMNISSIDYSCTLKKSGAE